MELSNQFLDPITMYALVDVIFSNSLVKGLNMVSKLMRVISDDVKSNIGDYSETLALLFFPTVFEQASWLIYSPIEEAQIARKTAVMRQELILRFHQQDQPKAIVTSPDKPQEKIRGSIFTQTASKKKGVSVSRVSVIGKIKMTPDQQNRRSMALIAALPSVRSIPSMLALEMLVHVRSSI